MIPRRAFFYWDHTSGEMSWLRQQGIASFRRLNPTWEVEILDGRNVPIKGRSRLAAVGRSDWGRYLALVDKGGIYFDSDIIFYRPIPDSWLRHEMVLPAGESQGGPRPTTRSDLIGHVACLGAESGNLYFARLSEACESLASSGIPLQYQAMGVMVANELVERIKDYRALWIEREVLIPVGWESAERLWLEGGIAIPISPIYLGVHWFGGDWTSMSLEEEIDAEWMRKSNCLVARMWRGSQ